MKRSSIFLILSGIIVSLSFSSLYYNSGYAKAQQQQLSNDIAQLQHASGNMRKITDIITQCDTKMHEDPSILVHCMKVVREFNRHMGQMFNDTR